MYSVTDMSFECLIRPLNHYDYLVINLSVKLNLEKFREIPGLLESETPKILCH